MQNVIILNDNYIDANRVSFISKIDSKVYAHINRQVFQFLIIVDGKEVNIELSSRVELQKLRQDLINVCTSCVILS